MKNASCQMVGGRKVNTGRKSYFILQEILVVAHIQGDKSASLSLRELDDSWMSAFLPRFPIKCQGCCDALSDRI